MIKPAFGRRPIAEISVRNIFMEMTICSVFYLFGEQIYLPGKLLNHPGKIV